MADSRFRAQGSSAVGPPPQTLLFLPPVDEPDFQGVNLGALCVYIVGGLGGSVFAPVGPSEERRAAALCWRSSSAEDSGHSRWCLHLADPHSADESKVGCDSGFAVRMSKVKGKATLMDGWMKSARFDSETGISHRRHIIRVPRVHHPSILPKPSALNTRNSNLHRRTQRRP